MGGSTCATLIMITLCFLCVRGSELIVGLNDVGFIIMIKGFECALTQVYANAALATTNGLIEC